MKKPTLDILDAISPEYNQYQGIVPTIARQNEYTSQFSLNNQAWDLHHSELNVPFTWKEFKYSDVVNKIVKINTVVPKKIGVYIFTVRPTNLVFGLPKYVYYVGIAGANGSTRTLRERLKDYFAKSHLNKRDVVRILIYKHYENIYVCYSSITLPLGTTIEQIEKSLIGFFGTHLLANRDDIPVGLQPQAKAFNI
ncbi:MAG: hypothetical protein AAB071_05095 [Bacteroidota bacterium]